VDDEEPDDEGTKLDLAYDFYFLTDEEAQEMNDEDHFWFKNLPTSYNSKSSIK